MDEKEYERLKSCRQLENPPIVSEQRRRYTTPRLITYGSVREVTATGSGQHVENTGNDMQNNMRRFP